MGGFGDLIVTAFIDVDDPAFVVHAALCLTVKHPEGDIDPLDLLNVVAVGERLGQQGFALVVLFQRRHRVLAAELEGDHEIRLQRAAELPRYHCWVSTVRAGGGGGGGVADQLRAAAWAGIRLHAVGLRAPVAGEVGGIPPLCLHLCDLLAVRLGFCLCRLGSGRCGCFLIGVQRFNLRDIVFRAAEITLQLTGRPHEMQGAGTRRAFIVRDLGGHCTLLSNMSRSWDRSHGILFLYVVFQLTEVVRAGGNQLAVVTEEQGQGAGVILIGVPCIDAALVGFVIAIVGAIHADVLLQIRVGQLRLLIIVAEVVQTAQIGEEGLVQHIQSCPVGGYGLYLSGLHVNAGKSAVLLAAAASAIATAAGGEREHYQQGQYKRQHLFHS